MKTKLKIMIDGLERMIKNETLTIKRGLKEYSASFSIVLPPDEVSSLHFGMDVQIFKLVDIVTDNGDGTTTTTVQQTKIYGGLINSINFKLLTGNTGDKVEVAIECFEYNILMNRFHLTGTVDTEPTSSDPNLDKNTAGLLAKKYVQSLLGGDGVTIGRIDAGAKLADTDIDELFLESLREILDRLIEFSGAFYQWKVDFNKVFHFYKDKLNPVVHSQPERLIKKNSYFRDISYNQDLTDYRNIQYIIGGEPTENLTDENLTPDGKLKLRVVMQSEIDKMAQLNGGTGMWENIYENDGIVTIAEATTMANDLLAEYSEAPAELSFTMDYDYFKEEDTIYATIPEFGLNNTKFTIVEMEIEDLGAGILEYRYLATQRSGNKTKTNFNGFLKDVTDLAKNPPIPKEVVPQDPGLLRDGLVSWIDASDTTTVMTNSQNKVLRVSDKNGGGYHVAQGLPAYQPTLISTMGMNYLDFNGSQYMGFETNIPNARTVFVVYKDNTLYNDSTNAGTLFMDGRFPAGQLLKGDGHPFNDNVFNSTSYSRMYQAWVNTVKQAPASIIRYRTDFIILAFTLTENLSVNNLFKSGSGNSTTNPDGILKGQFAELLLYNRVLADSEVDEVNSYLYNKYFG